MLEKTVKFFLKILLMIFTLFGVRYILSLIGVVIPLEWFIVMISGMLGFYGIVILIFYGLLINFILGNYFDKIHRIIKVKLLC